jgi:hypothetical protein
MRRPNFGADLCPDAFSVPVVPLRVAVAAIVPFFMCIPKNVDFSNGYSKVRQ